VSVRRLSWRWGVVAALVAVLASLPSLAGALPAERSTLNPAGLLERIRASGDVGWSGYGESRGSLVLPDVRELGDLPGLFAGTTRTRAWWRGPEQWRVDALTLVGEVDTTRDPNGGWTWDSADRRALRIVGELEVRLPTAADLLAPTLGRRLAGTADVDVSALPPGGSRGAPPPACGWCRGRPEATTVRSVDQWAEPRTASRFGSRSGRRAARGPRSRPSCSTLDLAAPPGDPHRLPPPTRAR
jgi:hypothetical protein